MLEVRALTKRYSGIPVVNSVSFTVRPFEVLGYLGPNGSGKSTTAKMLAGLIEPSQGDILFEGKSIRQHSIEYKKRLGYVPEEPHLYSYLTGREYLRLIWRLRGLPDKLLDQKIDAFLRLFSLYSYRHSAIASYSKGMRQKILISAALLSNPDVLILDEPDSGLDVTSMLLLRNLVKSLALEGKTILYSSHVLEVTEKICSRVLILHKGRIAADDSVDHLRDLMKLPSLEEIFAQLVVQEDTQRIASNIVAVMKQ